MHKRLEQLWVTRAMPLHNAEDVLVAIREVLCGVDITQVRGHSSCHEATPPAGRPHLSEVHQRHA